VTPGAKSEKGGRKTTKKKGRRKEKREKGPTKEGQSGAYKMR